MKTPEEIQVEIYRLGWITKPEVQPLLREWQSDIQRDTLLQLADTLLDNTHFLPTRPMIVGWLRDLANGKATL